MVTTKEGKLIDGSLQGVVLVVRLRRDADELSPTTYHKRGAIRSRR
jgi:hypothetical protein